MAGLDFTSDPFALAYFAIICGIVAGFTPRFIPRNFRVLLGAGIGIFAAMYMEEVRVTLGF